MSLGTLADVCLNHLVANISSFREAEVSRLRLGRSLKRTAVDRLLIQHPAPLPCWPILVGHYIAHVSFHAAFDEDWLRLLRHACLQSLSLAEWKDLRDDDLGLLVQPQRIYVANAVGESPSPTSRRRRRRSSGYANGKNAREKGDHCVLLAPPILGSLKVLDLTNCVRLCKLPGIELFRNTLMDLTLDGCRDIVAVGWKSVLALTGLRRLSVRRCHLKSSFFKSMCRDFDLGVLDISGSTGLKPSDMEHLALCAPSLVSLSLESCRFATLESLNAISSLSLLKCLKMSHCGNLLVVDAEVSSVDDMIAIRMDIVSSLRQLEQLESLDMSGLDLMNSDVDALLSGPSFSKLRDLHLANCKLLTIDDADIGIWFLNESAHRRRTELSVLSLAGCNVLHTAVKACVVHAIAEGLDFRSAHASHRCVMDPSISSDIPECDYGRASYLRSMAMTDSTIVVDPCVLELLPFHALTSLFLGELEHDEGTADLRPLSALRCLETLHIGRQQEAVSLLLPDVPGACLPRLTCVCMIAFSFAPPFASSFGRFVSRRISPSLSCVMLLECELEDDVWCSWHPSPALSHVSLNRCVFSADKFAQWYATATPPAVVDCLDLTGTNVDDDVLDTLGASQHLQCISLQDCHRITEAQVYDFVRTNPQLQEVGLLGVSFDALRMAQRVLHARIPSPGCVFQVR